MEATDYVISLKKVIDIISFFQNISVEDIVKNIMSPNQDILKFRFKGPFADQATLPLDFAIA